MAVSSPFAAGHSVGDMIGASGQRRPETDSELMALPYRAACFLSLILIESSLVQAQDDSSQRAQSCLWVESDSDFRQRGLENLTDAPCLITESGKDLVVLGEVLEESSNDRVGASQARSFLFDGWYTWRIAVNRTIGPAELPHYISVASPQHTGIQDRYLASFRLFVLRPIASDDQRKLLGADFLLLVPSQGCLDISWERFLAAVVATDVKITRPDSNSFCLSEARE